MIKAVLFDLGGTLHVSRNSPERKLWFARRLLDRLEDYGISLEIGPEALSAQLDVNAEIYKHASEISLKELPPEVVWNDYFLKEQKIGRERLSPMAEELSFLYDYERVMNLRRPRLTECMDTLRGMGLRLGIISNIISRSIVPHFMLEYGLAGYMDCVLTSAATGIRKPSPEIFRIAERELGLGPDALCYVGDTLSRDVMGARAAGWRMVLQIHNPGAKHRDAGLEGSGLAPDRYIYDLMEVCKIVKDENRRKEG